MARFKISGIWLDSEGVISHYAVHEAYATFTSRAGKMTKQETIELLSQPHTSACTWLWDYENAMWRDGEEIIIAGDGINRYLRTIPNAVETDNLGHLIKFNAITEDIN